MNKNIRTIGEAAPLYQATWDMEIYNVNRLIVVDSSCNAKGIITRTDVLCRIASLSWSATN